MLHDQATDPHLSFHHLEHLNVAGQLRIASVPVVLSLVVKVEPRFHAESGHVLHMHRVQGVLAIANHSHHFQSAHEKGDIIDQDALLGRASKDSTGFDHSVSLGELLAKVLLYLGLAGYVGNVAIDRCLRMRCVDISLDTGFPSTVDQSLRILDHLLARDAALVVIKSDPVSSKHHLRSFNRSGDLLRLTESIRHADHFELFRKRIWQIDIL